MSSEKFIDNTSRDVGEPEVSALKAIGQPLVIEAELATRRADANVALSLEVFGELFDKLAPKGDPFPPPTGRSQPRRNPRPGRDGGPPGDQPGRRPPPMGLAGNPFDEGTRPLGDPPGPPRRRGSRADAELLQNVLTFFDRFARQNAANPKLQGEAAWALFKVGALHEQLGRADDAEKAVSRASAMLDDLASRFPHVAEYRAKLVEVAIMADPWSADPSSLKRLEGRLRRARIIVDELAAESPENLVYVQDQVHVHAKLGVVLQRGDRPGDAEGCYRRAIALAGELIARSPTAERARVDRMDVREALAMLQLDRGRRDEAKSQLDAAAADLESLADKASSRIAADRYATLAEDYQRLGDPGRAAAMGLRAEAATPNPPTPSRGPEPAPRR